ncbi:MAG: ATP-dependent helicase HrpB, partial [Planctomycetes bacterium]|nr:ATP-dependent helicase HrpB [Planctomycetota bacterium]
HGGRGASLRDRERAADGDLLCRLQLAAFPDRVARRSSSDPNRATMVGGVAVEIDRGSALHQDPRGEARGPLLVVVDAQEIERGGRPTVVVRQAAETDERLIEEIEPGVLHREDALHYDADRGRVVVRSRWMYRDLCIREAAGETSDPARASAALAEALAPEAAKLFAEDEEAATWLLRALWLRAHMSALELPDFTPQVLAEIVAELCSGCVTRAEVVAKPKLPWLQARLSRAQMQAVDEHAPSHLAVPTGNRIRLDYGAGAVPVLAVRLQELFGMRATPRIAGGAVPVLLHLLAPNYRVEQVTADLASFWANTYAHVRKDLRGRYPKHSWPDDPLTAAPQAKGRPRT